MEHGRSHDDSHGHDHGVSANSDPRWLSIALGLILTFMAVEVIVGVLAHSLALITDAGHMLTDAASIVLAMIAIRLARRPAQGRFTYGFKRVEILSAQANGITLLLLAVWFVYEGIRRLIEPPDVSGPLVLITALVGIAVNIVAAWSISRANRTSLNIEGAFQHILNDLYAFIGTAVAGAVVWLTGFARADAIAALLVAVLMAKAGWSLVRESGRIFLEAAPAHLNPDAIGARIVAIPQVNEVHDLHVWQITSGQPSLSAHILVADSADCHALRSTIESSLHDEFGLAHTTLQVDHSSDADPASADLHCADSHGPVHRP
ncbi:cation diffusion facilitator family transporter [Nocardia australiensis]|uniref:cation diffusion facilitator family transporter n=1 Tax=Nocardia australiensis TaxID=2887191 RepID=UPI0027DEE158|nr:cation diffusion facilitator family transporter [Nocardia australiensis]